MTFELRWAGKYDAEGQRVIVPPQPAALRPVEWYPRDAGEEDAPVVRLIEGDNLGTLDALLATHRGQIDLVYLDPPFATGGQFVLQTRVGEAARPLELERFAYDDRFEGGVEGLLQMLDPRLRRMHELLSPHGSFYLHVDPSVSHAIKLLLDEIFGPECFQREIIWRIGWVSGFKTRARNWIRNHDVILFYTKDPRTFTFNKIYTPHPAGYRRRDGSLPRGRGVPIDDVWNANEAEFALRGPESLDSIQIKSFSAEKSGYATQKNESLLRRIVEASSNPGDCVLDPFCGSGSTGVAAVGLGRRFIGCELNPGAIHIAKKRLLEASFSGSVQVERSERGSGREGEPEPLALPLPEADIEIQETSSQTRVIRIRAFGYPEPEMLPQPLQGTIASGMELLDAWWVALDQDPPRVVFHAFRTHQRRSLPLDAVVEVPPGTTKLRLRLTDVLGRELDIIWSSPEDGG